ncbi:MAG: sel1 repeat family protein [Rhodospirillales bacterium]|nr:sel1 repeat family protein [Rhodospirillales bacterium]
MIGRVTRVSTRFTLALAAILAWGAAAPARADLYDLEGRYQCLENPDAVCYDATLTPTPPEPPAAPPPQNAGDAPAQPAATNATSPKSKKGKEPPPEPKPVDPMDLIAAHIQAGKPTADDLATLKTRAKASDRRAIEMLAWCAFVGIGGARDPVQAYVLYGQAAAAGSPTARKNQAAIFKGSLTLEQRQRVLDIENSRLKPGGAN